MTGRSRALRRYLVAWRLAGAVAVLPALLFLEPGWVRIERAGGLVAVGALLLATILAQRLTLHLEVRSGEERLTLSLVEAAYATAILVVGGPTALVILLVAAAIVEVSRRRDWMRGSFNVAQYAVAGALALWIHALILGGAPLLGARGVLAITLAMIAFGMCNWLAVTGAVSLAEGRSVWSSTSEIQQLSGASTLANTAVGVATALVWSIHAAYALIMLVPLVTLVTAYRGSARTAQLLRQVTADRDRTERVISGASDGIALLDHRTEIELWSPTLVAITGIEQDAAVGVPLGEIFDLRDQEGRGLELAAVVEELHPHQPHEVIEGLAVRPDGSERVVRVAASALFEGRTRSGTVLLVQDVTRERETERLKDDFLMRVSHELRTPLTPIKGFAHSLLMAGERASDEQIRQGLSRIVDRADHMVRLIDDLLLVAQAGPGATSSPDTIEQPVDLADTVRSLAARWKLLHADRDFATALETAMVLAPAEELDRMLDVLVDNAVRYSPPGTPVVIAVRRGDDAAEISVTDQGRGIPSDQIERIFDRFHRLEDPMRMTTGGLGVGLTIARRLARRAGGDIRVASRFGVGSTFVLELPLATKPSEPRRTELAR